MKAINIKVEHLKEAFGIDIKNPLVSWCLSGGKQTAYILDCYDGEELIYSSGKVETSSQQARIKTELKSRQRVEVKLSLFDENDNIGEVSSTTFEMALLNKSDWFAKWINPEETNLTKVNERPASYLKRKFEVENLGKSRLYITCHGLYEAFINGKRVGDQILTPGTSEYSKILEYQTYDVSELLKIGENEIEVILGDGWYRGKSGMNNPTGNLFGDDVSLLCQLEIDGKIILASDENWVASQDGQIRANGLDFGEIIDANIEPKEYHAVKIESFGYDNLVCSNSVPVMEKESFSAKLITTPNGEKVLDFGQNIAGYISFKAYAKKGQKIKLTCGESLDENGNFTNKNFQHDNPTPENEIKQQIEYTCKDGLNEYKPKFCIFGFRYAKLETDIELDKVEFASHAVYSDMEEVGSFVCENELVNKLVKNALWSMKGNFAYIPTDCPTRERQGWTGDAQAFVGTGMYLVDCYPVYRKWLRELRVSQTEEGKFPGVVPRAEPDGFFKKLSMGSAGWSDAITIIPSAMSERYDCTDILEENYQAMKKWVDFSEKRARKSRLKAKLKLDKYKKYIVDTGFHWGEWLEPDVDSKNVLKDTLMKGSPEVPTAYYAYSAEHLAKAAKKLDNDSDYRYYSSLSQKVKTAYRAYFVKNGKIKSDRQASYVRPIALNILSEREKKKAASDLNELVIKNNYHLNTGFLSTPYLCSVLSNNGFEETAFKLLLQDTSPSWLYSVKKGATTIWETWNGIDKNGKVSGSLNHYSYGAVVGWLFEYVAGIKVRNGKITVNPHPNEAIGDFECEYNSPVGKVSVISKHGECSVKII